MNRKNSTARWKITVLYMGEEIGVDVYSFSASQPACFDDEGGAAEVDYDALYDLPVVKHHLNTSEEFRELVIAELESS